VARLRLTWPQLHYSAALLDTLDNALSIYPAERPQSVAQMRARLGAAPAAAGQVRAASTAVPALNDPVPASSAPPSQPALNDALPSSPAPAPQAALDDAIPPTPAPAPQPPSADRVTQDFDVAMSVVPDPDPLATSGLARIDRDPSERTAFARQVHAPRRVATWTGAVFVLLALLVIGVFESGQEGGFGRVLDALGISGGTGVGDSATVSAPAADTGVEDSAAVSASAAGPAAPAPPPIAADAASAKPMPTEPSAADSPASASAPASPASPPIAADAGSTKPVPTERTAADSATGAPAPASRANPDRTTRPAAATAASAEPAAIAQPPATLMPPPTRSAQQHAARAPASPREACGARTQFSLYRCMKMQCSQHRWSSHAQCKRLRTTDSVD
jgi:non-specific serine/threonine protein kinase